MQIQTSKLIVNCQLSVVPRSGFTKIKIILLIALLAVIALSYVVYEVKYRGDSPKIVGLGTGSLQSGSVAELPKIDGLRISALKSGLGQEVTGVEAVVIKYRGLLKDETEFAKLTQFEFKFGDGNVLKIWEDGIIGMKIGEIRRLEIDPKLAYGEQGIPNLVPPNSTVIFEIELVEIRNHE